MALLADLVGVMRQTSVLSFSMGDAMNQQLIIAAEKGDIENALKLLKDGNENSEKLKIY